MRLYGCRKAADLLAWLKKWDEAKALSGEGYEIFPFLISHMTSKFDQENMVKSISGMAATGCALSLQCNDDHYDIIRILELGRGTISRLTINSKSDLSALHQQHPNLAKRFEDVRFIINTPFSSIDSGRKATPDASLLAVDLKNLLLEIRREKGFEDFQDLPKKDKLLDTADGETKILLNTTHFRTDAIMITANGRIHTLPLNPSIFKDAEDYHGQLCNRFGYQTGETWDIANQNMLKFLKWIWDSMVKPIFDALDLKPLTMIYEQEQLSHGDAEIARATHSSATRNPGGLHIDRLAVLQKLMKRHPNLTSSSHSRTSPSDHSPSPKSVNVSTLPRIHWIGVGFLSVFPFHAAGYGSQDPIRNTMS